jgi:hypothetical protein
MAKYARLSANNRLTVRQVEVINECLNHPENNYYFDLYNGRSVLNNAYEKLLGSIRKGAVIKYAFLGKGNRLTTIQVASLIGFLESIIMSQGKSNPQLNRVVKNAIVKLIKS